MTGKEVAVWRRGAGLSIIGLARELGVSRDVVRRLERTRGELPRRDQLMLRGLRVELLERALQEKSKELAA